LPEALEAVYFEWLHWPQASLPFSRETLEYIASLDGAADAALLAAELPELRPEGAGRLLQLTTLTLQRGAAAGLCLAEIGALMSRPLVRIGEEPSALEKMVAAALEALHLPGAAGADASSPGSAASLSESDGGGGWAEESPLGELSEGDEAGACAPTPRIAAPKRALGRGADCGGDGLQFDLDEGLEHAGAVAVPLGGHHAMPAHTLESDGTATECDGDSATSSAFGSHASSANGDWMAMGGHAGRSPASRPPAAPLAWARRGRSRRKAARAAASVSSKSRI
jgi:hypothetical protein